MEARAGELDEDDPRGVPKAVRSMVDAGTLRSTLGEHYGAINAANLKRAHALLESGKARGKLVLEGF